MAIVINGEPTRWFQTYKSFKQGDPLSILFIITVDILARILEKASSNFLIRGNGTKDYMTNRHCLQYTDDTLIFSNANKFHASNLKFILYSLSI